MGKTRMKRHCKECDAPVDSKGVYEGCVLGNLDDITMDDRNTVIIALVTLALYCILRNNSEDTRRRGDDHSAQKTEVEAERLFKTLPRWMRW